ncbi:MAG: Enoyl-CoA hydratase/carnithine racemase [Rhodobacteraceae bacterium HLUCCA12]|nr:MAG: Enoyl-CoA hydratase/carnithine racemase [Rhodobacteraceae bacterium HLUCCA12]
MNETTLRQERDGAVLVLTLDGGATRNAISPPVYRQVQAAVIDAAQDPGVRAIVLTGDNGFFSSGGNIHALKASAQKTMAEVTANTDALNVMIKALRDCPKPVVAAIEGGAAGAGASLALACDMIVAARDAKLVVAYVKVGLSPDGGVTHFLSRGLPRQLVAEMCMLGTPVGAERLFALGVVNALCDPGAARGEALALAQRLAAGATQAIARIKGLIEAAPDTDLATHLDREADGINRARFGDEAREGLAAFLDKRKPDFAGKG